MIERINSFRKLRDGWDSYDAIAPTSAECDAAIEFLSCLKEGSSLQKCLTHVEPSSAGAIVFSCNDEFVWVTITAEEQTAPDSANGVGKSTRQESRNRATDANVAE